MSLAAGSRIAHSEIVAPLGTGGMGEVYRARDSKLNRDVCRRLLLAWMPMFIAAGCAGASPLTPATEAPRIVTIAPPDLLPLPAHSLPLADRLALLHQALATIGDPHDALLELARTGDASSVPFLIEALAKQGSVPREGPYTAIDTRFHCLEALQVITNHNAGRNADDWLAWYEVNKDKPQAQWILEGFAQRQFPVADPRSDAFITALIRATDPPYQPTYIRTNARRMLTSVPAATVATLARSLAASADPADRRSTVAALEHLGGQGSLDVLRSLTTDVDVEVAENALRVLNVTLRGASPVAPAETVWDVHLARAGVHILYPLDDRTVVLGIGYGVVDQPRVVGFDLVAHRVAWSYVTGDAVRSNAVKVGDRLYFVSDDRVLHCISVRGETRWTTPLTRAPELGTTGPAITAVGDWLFIPDHKSIYVVSPSGQTQEIELGEHVSRDLVQGRRNVFAAIHNGPLLVLDGTNPPTRVPTGLKVAALSTGGGMICVVGFGRPLYLQCLSQDTLDEVWRAELPYEDGAYNELQQDADNVYVLAQGRTLAFSVATGKRLWATNEFTSGAFFKVLGRAILTRNGRFQLEWRDTQSGEVIAPWLGRDGGWAGNAALIGEAVLVETSSEQGSGLRLLKVPAAIKLRITAP